MIRYEWFRFHSRLLLSNWYICERLHRAEPLPGINHVERSNVYRMMKRYSRTSFMPIFSRSDIQCFERQIRWPMPKFLKRVHRPSPSENVHVWVCFSYTFRPKLSHHRSSFATEIFQALNCPEMLHVKCKYEYIWIWIWNICSTNNRTYIVWAR